MCCIEFPVRNVEIDHFCAGIFCFFQVVNKIVMRFVVAHV